MKRKFWIMTICFALLSIAFVLVVQPPQVSSKPGLASDYQSKTPAKYRLIPTSRESPGVWKLAELGDSSLPDLFIKGENGYKFDPNWQVATIDFSYAWDGPLPDEQIHSLQTLQFREGAYHNGDVVIQEATINAFLDSLDQLYPTNEMMRSVKAYDDDPIWRVEMVGQDGTHIYLYSNSNLIGATPWNVIYNGNIYVQYEGNVSDPLTKIFPLPDSKSARFSPPALAITDTLSVRPWGGANPLYYGFTGLFPIADHFTYQVDPRTKRILSTIDPLDLSHAFAASIRGKIDKLARVELTSPENTTISCTIEVILDQITPNYTSSIWEFTCPTEKWASEGNYRYPIHIQFGTDLGESVDTLGELYGTWEETDVSVRIPPDEVIAALQAYPPARDLVADHILNFDLFNGYLERSKGPALDTFFGQATLLGQVEINGIDLKYTAWTVVYVEHGKIARWDLNRDALNKMLKEILNLTIIQRVLDVRPTPTLNIWYSLEEKDTPFMPDWGFSSQPFGFAHVAACPPLPGEGNYPRTGAPLQGFGFNQSPRWPTFVPFLLIDGKPIVFDLYLTPAESNSELWKSLIPAELQLADHPLPGIAHFRSTDFESGPFFALLWEDAWKIPKADIEAYNALASKLPFSGEESDIGFFAIVFFEVTPDGQLKILTCEPTPTTTPIDTPGN